MKHLRIAVIDSGVHAGHPHILHVEGGVNLVPGGDPERFDDLLGHGTAVMAAIQEKAPDAEYYAVRVFDRTLRTTIDCLERAIEWSVAIGADLINLSLGTSNPAHAQRMRRQADAAEQAGALLVSAWPALPGCLDNVIGVTADASLDRSEFRRDGHLYAASPYPRSLPGVPRERNLYGISFAVANMTGLAARTTSLELLRRP